MFCTLVKVISKVQTREEIGFIQTIKLKSQIQASKRSQSILGSPIEAFVASLLSYLTL